MVDSFGIAHCAEAGHCRQARTQEWGRGEEREAEVRGTAQRATEMREPPALGQSNDMCGWESAVSGDRRGGEQVGDGGVFDGMQGFSRNKAVLASLASATWCFWTRADAEGRERVVVMDVGCDDRIANRWSKRILVMQWMFTRVK